MNVIGTNISLHRKARNLPQEELEEKLGVTNQAVFKWDTGMILDSAFFGP